MKLDCKETEAKMKKVVETMAVEFSSIRLGRANPAVLDKLTVDYYGTPTPINQVAAVAVAEARVLTIQPWDASLLKPIEKAIMTSDIGINPQNDGKIIRLNFPQMTEERRKEVAKMISKYGEEAKINVRNHRRDSLEKCREMKKKSEMTEDELKVSEKDLQTLTDKYCKLIDDAVAKKNEEIMAV